MTTRQLALVIAGLALAVTAAVLVVRPRSAPPGPDFARFEPADGQSRMIGDGHATKLRSIRRRSSTFWRTCAPARPGSRRRSR
jgi:hypothetical protein